MSPLELILSIAAVAAAVIGLAFGVITLLTAGRGSFLKERNEELAGALDQMRAQRDDDREECRRELAEQRDQINQLRGEVAAHRVQYAEVIATAVIATLEKSGWVKGGTL